MSMADTDRIVAAIVQHSDEVDRQLSPIAEDASIVPPRREGASQLR
jgi:hypothetical protein